MKSYGTNIVIWTYYYNSSSNTFSDTFLREFNGKKTPRNVTYHGRKLLNIVLLNSRERKSISNDLFKESFPRYMKNVI